MEFNKHIHLFACNLQNARIGIQLVFIFVICCVLNGCTTPIVEETDAPKGREYVSWIPAGYLDLPEHAQPDSATGQWWLGFESEELNQFVSQSLVSNFDLKAAIYRLAQLNAQADAVKAQQSPTLDAVVGVQNQGPWNGIATAPTTNDWSAKSVYQAGLRVNYEVDLWGKLGFNADSAYQKALSSKHARDTVALTLTADVVATYFSAVSLAERINVNEKNLKSIIKVGQGISERVRRGDASSLDLSQQLILEKNTEANLALLQGQYQKELNRLAQLIGTIPGTVQLKSKSVEPFKLASLQPGLPSDLLCRRPDIRAAEANLSAAQADLYAVRANLLPSFSLTGQGGVGSYDLSTFTSPQSLFFSITGNLIQSIFDGGKRKADIRAANARNYELLQVYASTVQSALRDVQDALSGQSAADLRYQALAQSKKHASQLAMNTRRLLQLGAIDFIQLLTIEQTVLTADDAVITARRDQLKANVDLFKAIGGNIYIEPSGCVDAPRG